MEDFSLTRQTIKKEKKYVDAENMKAFGKSVLRARERERERERERDCRRWSGGDGKVVVDGGVKPWQKQLYFSLAVDRERARWKAILKERCVVSSRLIGPRNKPCSRHVGRFLYACPIDQHAVGMASPLLAPCP